jgi:SAM-dependent methyltransferase
MPPSDYAAVPGVSRAIEGLDVDHLRDAIRDEYSQVATNPEQDFHFHTGRRLAGILGYDERWLEGVPEESIASFAGTGNPFSLGALHEGERVIDVGCGAGIDSLIAARMVGASGAVIGVDMTPAMVARHGERGPDWVQQRSLRAGLGRVIAGTRRVGGRRDLERRPQSVPRQTARLAGNSARAQAGRPSSNR